MGRLIGRYSETVGPIWPKINTNLPIDHMIMYTKFHFNWSRRLDARGPTDRRTDGQTDRRTDRHSDRLFIPLSSSILIKYHSGT